MCFGQQFPLDCCHCTTSRELYHLLGLLDIQPWETEYKLEFEMLHPSNKIL